MGEIEPQMVGIHQRPHLPHMGAEHLSERRVQQMGGRVIAADALATAGIHPSVRPRPRLQLAFV